MPDAVMLFAAGFGKRMGDLTKDRPKPLVEVAGRPLLDYALDLVEDVPRVLVNAHYRAEQIESHLTGHRAVLSVERPEILDTGGGLKAALPLLGQVPHDVYTLNSDAAWTGANPLATLAAAWDVDRMGALLLLVPAENARAHKGSGDFTMDAEGRLTRGPGFVYTGAQIIRTDALDDTPEGAFSLNLLWSRFAEEGRLFGAVHTGGWCDVGHPEGMAEAEEMLAGAAG